MSLHTLLESDRRWMRMALREAEKAFEMGEVPVGAVVVRNGSVIGRGHNRVEHLHDPTAHAELLAITAACDTIGSKVLDDATLYVTLEPCPMCAGAIVLSKIPRLVFGAFDEKAGACGSLFNIVQDPRVNSRAEIISGLEEDRCAELLRAFFVQRRDAAPAGAGAGGDGHDQTLQGGSPASRPTDPEH